MFDCFLLNPGLISEAHHQTGHIHQQTPGVERTNGIIKNKNGKKSSTEIQMGMQETGSLGCWCMTHRLQQKTLAVSTTICVCVPATEVDVTDDDGLIHKRCCDRLKCLLFLLSKYSTQPLIHFVLPQWR